MHNKSVKLNELNNLGPVSTGWLNTVGVHTRADLAELGPIEAYRILKAQDYPATLNLVYAIDGALAGRDWRDLPAARKRELRAAAADVAKPRCPWSQASALYRRYHDQEWGVPVHDDRKHFEFLILEGAQAGLSWITILKKRAAYRKAYAGFDPRRVARFGVRDVKRLLNDAGIVRNRLKIEAAITNARAFLAVQEEFSGFDHYVWRFVGGRPIVNRAASLKDLPATSAESDALSKDLKARGFRFVGPTIIYAHMQAVGMVNDHVRSCFRYRELKNKR